MGKIAPRYEIRKGGSIEKKTGKGTSKAEVGTAYAQVRARLPCRKPEPTPVTDFVSDTCNDGFIAQRPTPH